MEQQRVYNHIRWVDLKKDGVMQEVLVIKEDLINGDLYFIKINDLDQIDRERFITILRRRDAHKYPLWDLLSQFTLKNGKNALETYHQLVMMRTMTGAIVPPGKGVGTVLRSMSEELGIAQRPPANAPQAERVPSKAGRPATPKA